MKKLSLVGSLIAALTMLVGSAQAQLPLKLSPASQVMTYGATRSGVNHEMSYVSHFYNQVAWANPGVVGIVVTVLPVSAQGGTVVLGPNDYVTYTPPLRTPRFTGSDVIYYIATAPGRAPITGSINVSVQEPQPIRTIIVLPPGTTITPVGRALTPAPTLVPAPLKPAPAVRGRP